MADTPSPRWELPHDLLDFFQGAWSGARIEDLGGAGGFSGARFWRITAPSGRFCLRRWPREHPPPRRLALQHSVLAHAQRRGIDFVPVPLKTVQGGPESTTAISFAGHLWELTPWMPGEADFFPEMNAAKLTAATKALARFHKATGDFAMENSHNFAPSAKQRLQLVDEYEELSPKIAAAIRGSSWERELAAVAGEILDGFTAMQPLLRPELTQACHTQTRLQPAIRDVRSDHILFQGNTVTGIVDFGAMRIDSIAVDIARLLGSMAGDDERAWRSGMEAYESVRPLDATQRRLVTIFDRSSVVLSGMNWLRWIFVDHRSFEDLSAVAARLSVTRDRLRHLMHQGGRIRP